MSQIWLTVETQRLWKMVQILMWMMVWDRMIYKKLLNGLVLARWL